MTTLVVAAHPDDELLGAGGTIALRARNGDPVHVVVMSEGASSRYEGEARRSLEEAGGRAAGVLGVASIRFEGLPDQRLDTLPAIELTQLIESIVERFEPDSVLTHHAADVNLDHQVLARAVWTACRPYRFPHVTQILAFETPSSTEWRQPSGGTPPFEPNLFVDIGETIDAKIAAMECYESELRPYPHPRSARALRERAAYWGSVIGRETAEPFVVLRETR